ncbi:Histone deacetylase complex subunit SAP18 [Trifolium repens]|nr:Histone deacetylase complex subunit SAP18 [Trifolium repens]
MAEAGPSGSGRKRKHPCCVSSQSKGRPTASRMSIRVFFEIGKHHPKEMFDERTKPSDEIIVRTWMDSTLKDITRLVKDEVHHTATRKHAKFSFAIVSRNEDSKKYEVRKVGQEFCFEEDSKKDQVLDNGQTLQELGFKNGDFLDVAIL